jgi:hypothetical protein
MDRKARVNTRAFLFFGNTFVTALFSFFLCGGGWRFVLEQILNPLEAGLNKQDGLK